MKSLQEKVHAGKQALLNEKDIALSKLKEEMAQGKVSLVRVEAESISLKQELCHYKDQLRRVKRQNEEKIKVDLEQVQKEEKFVQAEDNLKTLTTEKDKELIVLGAEKDRSRNDEK